MRKPISPIPDGETRRYLCDGCMTEYEIELEPKVREHSETPDPKAQKIPLFCPFCGSDNFDEV